MPARKPNRPLENTRVRQLKRLVAPKVIKKELPARGVSLATVVRGRSEAQAILQGRDSRLLASSVLARSMIRRAPSITRAVWLPSGMN